MSIVDDRICHVDTVLDRIQIFNQTDDTAATAPEPDNDASVNATDAPVQDADTTPLPTDSTRISKLKSVCHEVVRGT